MEQLKDFITNTIYEERLQWLIPAVENGEMSLDEACEIAAGYIFNC